MSQIRETILIRENGDVVKARQVGRDIARKLGFRVIDQTRLATAISELTRNILRYAGDGICHINGDENGSSANVEVIAEDNGPGIVDIAQVMQDGFSTGNGLGAGLPGTRRLMDQFEITSQPGLTRVTVSMKRTLKR
ncbi:MAG: anti-sigma regulatory factor [Candidatus Thiodiazotropha sp.]